MTDGASMLLTSRFHDVTEKQSKIHDGFNDEKCGKKINTSFGRMKNINREQEKLETERENIRF